MAISIVKTLVTFGFAPLALTFACASMPAKAPGSNPRDMTPEAHRQASDQEAREAEEHQNQADRVQPSKPAVENAERSDHERQAERHQTYSDQHGEAARAAESGAGD